MTNSLSPILIRHQYNVSGSWDYALSKGDSFYKINFGNGYQFQVHPQFTNQEAIKFLGSNSSGNFRPEIKDHLIKNQITPMLKAWNGSIVFHASGVKCENNIWGFLGNSGAGKSTLAQSLSKNEQLEHWSDDWLEIRNEKHHFRSCCNSFSIRLDTAHAKNMAERNWLTSLSESTMSSGNKLLIPGDEISDNNSAPINLSHLCEIIPCTSSEKFSLIRLKSSEAFRCVSQHLFRLDTTKPDHLQREFTQLTKLVEKVPIYRMHYPHRLSELSNIHQEIIKTFQS